MNFSIVPLIDPDNWFEYIYNSWLIVMHHDWILRVICDIFVPFFHETLQWIKLVDYHSKRARNDSFVVYSICLFVLALCKRIKLVFELKVKD
jgi:hypothetical protein